MANEIRIECESDQLTRGTAMKIPIKLVLERPLKVRGIHAKFHGAEETKAVYTTTSVNHKGHTTTHTHTAIEHADVVNQPFHLLGNAKLGFFGNVSDAAATLFGGGKHETLQPGEYAFEVEVAIPEDAPATHVGEKTRVFYELSIHVDVPLAGDLIATKPFKVLPLEVPMPELAPVRTCYPDDAGKGYIDSMFGPDVRIEMALAANCYRVGEMIDGIVIIETTKPLSCRAVVARLVGTEASQAQTHKDSYVHQTNALELAKPGTIQGSFKQEFSIPVSTVAPLSTRGKRFSIDWCVQIEFDVPWAKDPKIRAPIVLLPAEQIAHTAGN